MGRKGMVARRLHQASAAESGSVGDIIRVWWAPTGPGGSERLCEPDAQAEACALQIPRGQPNPEQDVRRRASAPELHSS